MEHFLIEPVVAFLLVISLALVIYFASKRLVPKSQLSEEKSAMYACGEKVVSKRLLVNVTLYKYLIFFVIIDTPAFILAFATLALETISPIILLVYLGIVLAADLLLLGGL